MEYQETELEMLNQEISRKDEPLARLRFQIEDLVARNTELTKERDDAVSHIKDVLEQRNLLRVKAASYHDKNLRLKKILRDMRSNYDRCLAYMDGQEPIIDEKDKTIDELRQSLKDKTIDELKHKLVGAGRKDHD